MIARITGRVEQVSTTAVLLDVGGGLTYEVLAASCDVGRLSSKMGQAVVLHTLHFIEGDPGRGPMTPRLVGFLSEDDREFFRIYTTVKGVGIRKALKSLARPIAEVAAAIESKDEKFLQTLPQIGKRAAEQIIAELNGKVGDYAAAGHAGPAEAAELSEAGHEAVAVLVQLGERRADAEALVERVLAVAPDLTATEAIIQNVYRIKAGG